MQLTPGLDTAGLEHLNELLAGQNAGHLLQLGLLRRHALPVLLLLLLCLVGLLLRSLLLGVSIEAHTAAGGLSLLLLALVLSEC